MVANCFAVFFSSSSIDELDRQLLVSAGLLTDWIRPIYAAVCCRLDAETGDLTMKAGARKGEHKLLVNVEDSHWEKTVMCTVIVTVVYLNDTVVSTSASLRLSGTF